LRERSEDIPLLVRHFLSRSAANLGVEPKRLSDSAMAFVRQYAFPGNVRQLENLCQWITVMAPGQTVESADLPPEFRLPPDAALSSHSHEADASPQPASVPAHTAAALADGDWLQLLAREVSQRLAAGETGIIDDLTARFESTCIKSGLAHTGGRKVEAAQLLGWGRNTLTRKIQELGLEHE
ncbi:MAG: helix-turn-helix domain-containing protein, partial [Vogesella sp.]|uniref:helix-turn-helix domain-containing protein n=1 Tax=Vogesella sp. TaxID=1904252 RepID=UPI003F412B5E